MADELNNKPEFIVHKRQQNVVPASTSASGSGEKKRVVVVKKKTQPAQNATVQKNQSEQPKKNVHLVVKRTESQPQPTKNTAADEKVSAEQQENKVQQVKATENNLNAGSSHGVNNTAAAANTASSANAANNTSASVEKKTQQGSQQAAQQSRGEQKNRPFELNPSRPNVKAGNLSDRGRQNQRNNGGYNNRNQNGGNGRPYNRDGGGSNFTGAQARQGYQNRERDSNGMNRQNGYNNRQGQNRQGGNGNFQNRQNGANGGNPRFNNFNNNGGNFRPRQNNSDMGMAAPLPVDNSRQLSNKKAAYKGKKQIYNRKDEEQFDDKFFEQKKKVETPASVVPKSIDIMETVSVSDLARKMNLKASEVIAKLMGMGEMVTITQSIDHETAGILAAEYGCEVHIVNLYDETVIESEKDEEGVELKFRPPIVTVMGHVDHGKTKTLDAIRHSHVAEGEAGGITQSIGAYSVTTPKGKITFLDTPGHEAFTMMRARGAQVTDIVVLVVAADDGVMPQTLEAIAHAKDAKVPIIVAVNKVDKPEANPDRVKTQLSDQGLTPEEWGGDTQYVHISALKKEGIDDLLEAILLQAEMLELKVNDQCRAEGKILESRVDQGRGVVSTVIIQRGTLHQGDPFVAGIYSGRVRAMFDDRGRRIQEAGPSTPVEVLGMEEMPNAGDPFQVTESEKDARAVSNKRQELKRSEAAKAVKKTTLESLYSDIADSEVKELKVIIKADLQGSAEALKSSLEKLSTREIRLSVIHSSAGAINESDVTLAAADSNAIIIGFNVRPTPKAKTLAEQERVEIRKYNIIYKCVEEIKAAMEGLLQPDTKEEVIGQVEVRDTFKVPKVGVIAGCMVSEGIVRRTSSVNLIRDGIVKFTGKISSLKRFKDDAKEVSVGYECGIGLENWQDIQVGDKLEVFEIVEVAKKLGKSIAEEEAEAAKRNVTASGSEGA